VQFVTKHGFAGLPMPDRESGHGEVVVVAIKLELLLLLLLELLSLLEDSNELLDKTLFTELAVLLDELLLLELLTTSVYTHTSTSLLQPYSAPTSKTQLLLTQSLSVSQSPKPEVHG